MGTAGKSVLSETSIVVGCSHKPNLKTPQNLFKGPNTAAQVIFNNLQEEKQSPIVPLVLLKT